MLRKLKDFFIPHKGNGYRPNFLERVSVGVMLVLILLSFAMANLQALLWISSDWLVSTILPAVIIDLTNSERDAGELGVLVHNPILDTAAQLKANHMAANGYFAHYSPDGTSPWHWFDEAGYNYLHAGENLAVHFTDSDEVVKAWMKSPSHRANIMNGEYREIGIGTARGEYNGYPTIFVVQLFGTQRSGVVSSTVAGASTDSGGEVTIEKVVSSPAGSDVAQASVETQVTQTEEKVTAEEPSVVPVIGVEPDVQTVAVGGTEIETLPSIVLRSDTATTSREGVALLLDTDSQNTTEKLPAPLRSATASSVWLSTVYAVLALFVTVSLVTSLILEWKRHHPVQSLYAGGLLTVMALLLYIHVSLTSSVTIL